MLIYLSQTVCYYTLPLLPLVLWSASVKSINAIYPFSYQPDDFIIWLFWMWENNNNYNNNYININN